MMFLTAKEKDENENLDNLENEITAQMETFSSKDQQRALVQYSKTVASIEFRLTKGDIAPPQADL